MLLALPPEILFTILDFCNRKEVLKNLCLVSKALNFAVTPRLYRSLALRAKNEANISDFAVDCLLKPSCRHIKHTREIILTAEFHELLLRRCHDHDPSDDGTDDDDSEFSSSNNDTDSLGNSPERVSGERTSRDDQDDEDPQYQPGVIPLITEWSGDHSYVFAHENSRAGSSESSEWDYDEVILEDLTPHGQFMKDLESRIQPLLYLFPEAKLERFSWNLGTCIPESVIEYLILKQPQITCLEIVTDSRCVGKGHLNTCDLRGLKALRRIRWVGYNEYSSKTLGRLLRANALALEEIEIDEVRCRGIEGSLTNKNMLLNQVLKLPPGSTQQLFPSLKILTLSAISLQNGCHSLPSVFSFKFLHSLAIRNCPKAANLLRVLGSSDIVPPLMQLKVFEFSDNGWNWESRLVGSLFDFLQSFDGLEDLFLSFSDHFGGELLGAILNHKTSLRRLVCHYPKINARVTQPLGGLQSRSFAVAVREIPDITCLGINLPPKDLCSVFSQPDMCPRLQLLHVRALGWLAYKGYQEGFHDKSEEEFSAALPDIHQFASWAFGPEGFPSLQVLCYGDFSYHGRRPHITFCRSKSLDCQNAYESNTWISDQTYRVVSRQDIAEQEILHTNARFLEACAEDPIMYIGGRPF